MSVSMGSFATVNIPKQHHTLDNKGALEGQDKKDGLFQKRSQDRFIHASHGKVDMPQRDMNMSHHNTPAASQRQCMLTQANNAKTNKIQTNSNKSWLSHYNTHAAADQQRFMSWIPSLPVEMVMTIKHQFNSRTWHGKL
ncbi:hypothetical protein V8E55_007187 [Tylopilus felleus]